MFSKNNNSVPSGEVGGKAEDSATAVVEQTATVEVGKVENKGPEKNKLIVKLPISAPEHLFPAAPKDGGGSSS